MRDFCDRERLRDGKYLGAGDRERDVAGNGERERGESDDEGDFEGD
jgi:hypothetical protein